jgi:hypothetical protein
MPATYATATAGWSCNERDGVFDWRAWNEHGNLHGTARSVNEARDLASRASAVLAARRALNEES